MKLILALFFGEILAILPFILATNDDGSHSSDQGPDSSQNTPENDAVQPWTLSVLDGLSFVHHHDAHFRQNAIVNDRDSQIWDFPTNSMRANIYFQKLRQNLKGWNQKLDKIEKEAIVEDGQALSKYYAGEITSHQIDQPKQILDGISLIYRVQNATIGHYFLSAFLNSNGAHQKDLGTALRKLELKGKILDLERYEEKMQRYKADMEGAEILLQEKLKYYQRKNYPKSDYKYNDYLETLVELKNALQKTRIIWMQEDLQETDQFWTNDQRPVVNQTLWVIRHAQRLDNVSKNWFDTLDGQDPLARQDVPLSDRGIQQAKELGKWFQYIPVDKVYASPFKRTMQTASGLLRKGEHQHYHPQVYINIEPGLTEFFKPCSVKIGFLDKEKLHKEFPLADPNYRPIYSKKALELMAEERKTRPREEMQDCNLVLIHTLLRILQDNQDGKNCCPARHIVLISHSGIISLIHELLTGHWAAVGQTTISKFVRFEEDENLGKNDNYDKNDDNLFRKFRLEYSGDLSHLSDHDYLRPH